MDSYTRARGTRHIRPWLVLLLVVWAPLAFAQDKSGQKPAAGASSGKESPEAHLGKGYDALKQDRYEVAVSEFRAALALDPKLVLRARFPLAVALFELKKPEEARREFEAVRRETGDHPNVLYYLGRLDLADGNLDSAIANLSEAAAKPPFPDTAYYLGYAYFKRGNLPAAEKWLQEATELNPHDARMMYQLGLVYRKEGREDDAKRTIALSEERRQRDANDSKLRLECAQKLEQSSRDEARALCDQLYDPDDADKLTALGALYAQRGDLEAALKPLRRAAELMPQSPQTQYNLALACFQMGQFEQARAPLAATITRWPDIFQLNALYGAVLLKLGEDLPAYEALHHARELNAQDPATAGLLYAVTLTLAHKSQAARKYPDAIRYLQEAAKLRPSEPEPHRGLAQTYKLTGRKLQAAAEQKKADRLSASSPD